MNYLELWRWRHYSKFEVPRLMTNRFLFGIDRSSYRHAQSCEAQFTIFQRKKTLFRPHQIIFLKKDSQKVGPQFVVFLSDYPTLLLVTHNIYRCFLFIMVFQALRYRHR